MWLFLLAFGCLDPVPTDDTDPVDDTATDTDPWPATLRGTGLYADEDTLADGVIAFEVAWPLWSDGSTKERFLWLPEGTAIDASDPDRWAFPVGTKAWKT